jgi:hypothetical protein
MEEIVDDFSDIVIPRTVFVAVYDPDTGKVKSVGPDIAFSNNQNKIVIDEESASSIINGKISLNSCFVDPSTNKLEIAEIKTFLRIDDILHRVPDSRFTEVKKVDLLITYFQETGILKFKMNCKAEKISSPELYFLITEYNDPNILYQKIKLSKSDLIKGEVEEKLNDDCSDFSIFTKRIIGQYLNYLLEVV